MLSQTLDCHQVWKQASEILQNNLKKVAKFLKINDLLQAHFKFAT